MIALAPIPGEWNGGVRPGHGQLPPVVPCLGSASAQSSGSLVNGLVYGMPGDQVQFGRTSSTSGLDQLTGKGIIEPARKAGRRARPDSSTGSMTEMPFRSVFATYGGRLVH